jgi:hypothetical protein
MADEPDVLRDWHRLFGLLLTDFFTGSPFTVDIERDLPQQQQFLDVVIVRRGRGRFAERLPDGLDDLTAHNLITFKSHHEALDTWAIRELIGHYVSYRKLVSPSRSDLVPEDQLRLYAVCARFPHNLSGQIPWQERQAGVYDCRWGADLIRVVVAGQLAQQGHNAPLHLFSASAELIEFGRGAYRQRCQQTSGILGQLFERFRGEGFAVSYTMADFTRDFVKQNFPKLTPEQRREVLASLPPEERQAFLASLPPEERLAGLSPEQAREFLERLTAGNPTRRRKPRRKK